MAIPETSPPARSPGGKPRTDRNQTVQPDNLHDDNQSALCEVNEAYALG
jgi:hypothetical protein